MSVLAANVWFDDYRCAERGFLYVLTYKVGRLDPKNTV